MTMVLCLSLAVASGTLPITLDEARTASRNNVAALKSELEAERSLEQRNVARGALLPSITVSGGYNTAGAVNIGGAVVPGIGGAYFTAQLRQLLYDGSRWANLAQTGAVAEAARGEATEQSATSELEGIRRFF